MEQMMELLKAMQEMVETQIGSLASWMDTHLARIEANQREMMAELNVHHEQTIAEMDA
jgi:hypothetical protein